MADKLKILLLLMMCSCLLIGCSTKETKPLTGSITVKAKRVTIESKIDLEVELVNQKEANCSYEWVVEGTAGKIKGYGSKAVYTAPDKAGNYKVKAKVTNAGREVTLSKRIKVTADNDDSNQSLTINYPEEIVVGQQVMITGQAREPINKVAVFKNSKLKSTEVKDGRYKIKLKFQKQGQQQLRVVGFTDQDKSVAERKVEVNIKSDSSRRDLGAEFVNYADNNYQKLMQEAKEKVGEGGTCVAFISAALRDFGYDIDAVVTDGVTGQQTKEDTLVWNLFDKGFKKANNLAKIKPGDICFSKPKHYPGVEPCNPYTPEQGKYFPNHAFIFKDWVNSERRDYAWVVDNQGTKHKRSMTGSSYGYFMYLPRDDQDGSDEENVLTLDLPASIEAGEEITISGRAAGKIEQVRIKLDGKQLAVVQVEAEQYSLDYTFKEPGTDKRLVIKGLNSSGQVIKKITKADLVVEKKTDVVEEKEFYQEAAGVNVWKVPGKNGFFYEAEMTIDADGAPRAYHPKEGKGLDYTANAGHPGNWWGIATKNGEPVIQDEDDPAPGYYVSTTALIDYDYGEYDPHRYTNSSKLPFYVLPSGSSMGAELGDYGVVYNQNNGKLAYAIYADIGPTDHIGEGSIALADKLGINSNPKYGGIDGNIIYLVFPNSGAGQGTIPKKKTIHSQAKSLFEDWGGRQQLKTVIN